MSENNDIEINMRNNNASISDRYLDRIFLDFKKLKKSNCHKSKLSPDTEEQIQNWTIHNIRIWLNYFYGKDIDKNDYLYEIISVVIRAATLAFELELRDVQLIAVLALLNKDEDKGRLLQVSTGEGKSMIIAVLAAIKVLLGDKTVDVITSSDILAQRDSKNNKKFFELLNINCANNIDEKVAMCPKECYKSEVVYGSTSSFQSDILYDEYKLYGTLNGRQPNAIIIDEVDNMFVDEYGKSTYLTEPKPGLEKIKVVFFLIWQHLKTKTKKECEKKRTYKEIKIILESYLNDETNDSELRRNILNIPEYLKSFIEENINGWIKNCILAKFDCRQNEDYIVQKETIVPVDQENTGSIQYSSRLGNGLQQFLELKHQIKMSDFSFITNYLSNIGFFQRYFTIEKNNICGLTGTLGSDNCKKILDDIYHVDFINIPTFKERNFIELEGVITKNEKEWLNEIHKSVEDIAINKKRAVLVIAETIHFVKKLEKSLKKIVDEKYLKAFDQEFPEIKDLRPGEVILSTNLAGRGVDIKLDKNVISNGGLHVCLTFLSINSRVELQAFGRAARKGQPGTAQMILNLEKEIKICNIEPDQIQKIVKDKHLLEQDQAFINLVGKEELNLILNNLSDIKDFKLLRDKREKEKLDDSLRVFCQIVVEDELFKKFCNLIKEISQELLGFEKQMLLDGIEERWAIWLTTLNKDLEKEENFKNFDKFKGDILNNFKKEKNKYKCIQNSSYLDQICLNGIQNLESNKVKFLRAPFQTRINLLKDSANQIKSNIENQIKSIITNQKPSWRKETVKFSVDDIINICDVSFEINPYSFIVNMNKAVCLIHQGNESKDPKDPYPNYKNAIEQYKLAKNKIEHEIMFWSLFQLNTTKNSLMYKIAETKIELYAKINDSTIKNNIAKLSELIEKKEKAILIEVNLKELLTSSDELDEMRRKGLESIYIIKKRAGIWHTLAIVGISVAQLALGGILCWTSLLMPYFGVLAGPIGKALLFEGASDLFYAITVGVTSDISWKEFWIQKGISVVLNSVFVGMSTAKFLESEILFNILKSLNVINPSAYLYSFLKSQFGVTIKALIGKFTGNFANDGFLWIISNLMRQLGREKFKTEEQEKYIQKIKGLAEVLNRNMQHKINQIRLDFEREAQESDERFDKLSEKVSFLTDLNEKITQFLERKLKEQIELSTLNEIQETNNEQNDISSSIHKTLSQIEDSVTEELDKNYQGGKLDDADLIELAQNAIEKSLIINESTLVSTESIESKIRNLSKEANNEAEKKRLIEIQNNFQNIKIKKLNEVKNILQSENIDKRLKEMAINKIKDKYQENLMNEMKNAFNKAKSFSRKNAYTTNEDPYEYSSFDIEHISNQLLKQNIRSGFVLVKPINRDNARAILLNTDLKELSMIFYDIGELKWVAYFLIKDENKITILGRNSCTDLNSFQFSVNYIKDILKEKYHNINVLCYINDSTSPTDKHISVLLDMKVIADEILGANSAEFVLNFQNYSSWLIHDERQKNEFAEMFAINFLETEFEKFILIKHENVLKKHHESQLHDLKTILENFSQEIKAIINNPTMENINLENSILLDLSIDCVEGKLLPNGQTIIYYDYSYLINFENLKIDAKLKSLLKDEICIHYNLTDSYSDLLRIPAKSNTNGQIRLKDKLELPLYDIKAENGKMIKEDSVFNSESFLLILAYLNSEILAQNEKLAKDLFKRTKFYDANYYEIISDNFQTISRFVDAFYKNAKEEMKKKEENIEQSDDDYSSNDESNEIDLDTEISKYSRKREAIIEKLHKLNITPTEENINLFLND